MIRPTVPQLFFAATAVAAVIAMPTDALTASSSPSPASVADSPIINSPVAMGTPATAVPIRQVRPSTDEQIARAVRTSPLLGEVQPDSIRVTDIHVSTIDPTVAVARIIPTGGETDPATVLLRHGGNGWTVVELGTAEVGCDKLDNPAVRDELGLICEPF